MLIGYMRVSTEEQLLDLQRNALVEAGVKLGDIYEDTASGSIDDRPGLGACLKALREGDVLVIWRLDRLGRNLKHLVETVDALNTRGVGFKVITGAPVDTTTAVGRFTFAIFASLAEFERETIRERTMAGLRAARARGRKGGRQYVLTPAKLRLAQAAMQNRDGSVAKLREELGGIAESTLYRYVTPKGLLTEKGVELLEKAA